MIRNEKKLNNLLLNQLNIDNLDDVVSNLRILSKVKTIYAQQEGFDDSRKLSMNIDDCFALERTANILEYLNKFK